MLSVYVQLPYVGQPEELSGFCIILYMVSRRNCLLKHVIEGKIEEKVEGVRRRGRRCKQLLDDVKEKRRYWKLKEEALDRTLRRARFGRRYGPFLRQTAA
jgi:hypothetical protein